MDTLQQALNQALSDIPYQALSDLVVKKLAASGTVLSPRERRRLTAHLKSNMTDTFYFRKWQWWSNRAVNVELTPEDVEPIHERFSEFLETRLPTFVDSIAEDLSSSILANLHKRWHGESRRQKREIHGFQQRLQDRWGHGIELLRMFLIISREFGSSLNTSLRSQQQQSRIHLVEVLTRLHARACQVTEEVICLLSAGLADGAMARWRTLHEIAVVAFFVKANGESVAKRYVDHQIVESYHAAKDYRRCFEQLGYEPLTPAEFNEIQQAFNIVRQRYGSSFETQYGWAAEVLRPARPTFRHIEEAAGIDHFRAHYRMASHNVHANPKGVFFKLGLLKECNILLPGVSNAGLADPGHSTAISLLQVSTALGLIEPTLDSLVTLKILIKLGDEVGEAFNKAHHELVEDDFNQTRLSPGEAATSPGSDASG